MLKELLDELILRDDIPEDIKAKIRMIANDSPVSTLLNEDKDNNIEIEDIKAQSNKSFFTETNSIIKWEFKLNQLVTWIATRLVKSSDIDLNIRASLKEIAAFLNAKKVSIFLMNEERTDFSRVYDYDQKSYHAKTDLLIPINILDKALESLFLRKPLIFTDLNDQQKENEKYRQLLILTDNNPSLVLIPIIYGIDVYGLLIASDDKKHEWKTFDLKALQQCSQIISGILQQKRTNLEFKKAQWLIESIMENIPDIIYSTDEKWNFTYISPKIEQLLTIQKENLSYKNLWLSEVFHEDIHIVSRLMKKIMNGGSFSEEFRIGSQDEVIWIKDSGISSINDKDQRIERIDGIITDITARKKIEEALVQFGNEFVHLIESANAPIFGIDINGYLNEWNKSIEEITDQKKLNILGKSIFDYIDPLSTVFIRESIDKMLNGEEIDSVIFPIITKQGDTKYILTSLMKRESFDKKVLGVLFVGQDITQRKMYEEELANSRDRLAAQVEIKTKDLLKEKKQIEAILEAITDGIIVVENDKTCSRINDRLKEIYKQLYDESFPIGINIEKLPPNIFTQTILDLIQKKKSFPITIETNKGIILQLSLSSTEKTDFQIDSNYSANIIQVKDVTSIMEFNTLRKRFVSSVSHELRTPISVVVQCISILSKYMDKLTIERRDKLIDTIYRNANLTVDLIDDLLVLSRVDEGRLQIRWEKCKLINIFNNVVILMEPKRKAKSIPIKAKIDETLVLLGDIQKISQVFRIFIDNAIKYSKTGSTIEIEAIDNYLGEFNTNNVDGILLVFRDTGIGIQAKEIPNLFERFYRSESVTNIQGTGLGLAISKEIVDLHQGEIYTNSTYGKGTTFSIFLPKFIEEPK